MFRGIEWPLPYNGRGILKGDDGWVERSKVTAYAVSAAGLVKEGQFAKSVIDEVRQDISKVLMKISKVSSKLR